MRQNLRVNGRSQEFLHHRPFAAALVLRHAESNSLAVAVVAANLNVADETEDLAAVPPVDPYPCPESRRVGLVIHFGYDRPGTGLDDFGDVHTDGRSVERQG
jgi:hypothetical protein